MKTVEDNKCPSCGANILFNPLNQNWCCEYCGQVYMVEEFEKNNKEENDIKELDEYSCPNCGAAILTEQNTAATHCVYCGNTTIIKNRLSGQFKPDKIIPFETTKEQAMQEYKKFIRKMPFAPFKFRNKENIKKISGVYIPFWLYNCTADGEVKAKIVKRYRSEEKNNTYIVSEKYECLKKGKLLFNDIPIDGSKKFDDNVMDSIQPYDYKKFTKFNKAFLSGFLAEKYDIDEEKLYDKAKKRVTNTASEEFKNSFDEYEEVLLEECNVEITKSKVEYALLPVWMLNINFKNKIYTFAMNGQTRKVVGNVPFSILSYIFNMISALAISISLIFLILYIFVLRENPNFINSQKLVVIMLLGIFTSICETISYTKYAISNHKNVQSKKKAEEYYDSIEFYEEKEELISKKEDKIKRN